MTLKGLKTNDYRRAGYLSLFLLWNKPTLKESVNDFNKRIKKRLEYKILVIIHNERRKFETARDTGFS